MSRHTVFHIEKSQTPRHRSSTSGGTARMPQQPAAGSNGRARLNILLVGSFDSANGPYVELFRELAARGHACTVVVENERDSLNNSLLINAGIPLVALRDYPLGDLRDVDMVFTGPFIRRGQRSLFDAIYRERVPVIAFAGLFMSTTLWPLPDVVIATSEAKFAEFADAGLAYRMVALGNPQYDPLIRARELRETASDAEIRNVLVVDQGAYPLGAAGKQQLADTLIAMARNNPNTTFRVKPRYPAGAEGDHLHTVPEHLHDYLADAPDNLVVIQTSRGLEELVVESEAMITTWSTAYLDAIAYDIPLLIIEGLDSEDVYDVRAPRVAAAYDRLRESGCVVHRDDLLGGAPPFARVSPDHASGQFYDISAPCAPRVVDLLETLNERVFGAGQSLSGPFQLPYSQFMQQVDTLAAVPTTSTQSSMLHRYQLGLNKQVQTLGFDNRCMGVVLDVRRVLPLWDRTFADGATQRDVDAALKEARAVCLTIEAEYFASHPHEVATDKFVQDRYFDWLLRNGRYHELWSYSGPVLVPESLEFNRGKAYLKRGRLLRAKRHLITSFELSLRKPGRELKKDRDVKALLSRADRNLLGAVILLLLGMHGDPQALSGLDVPSRPGMNSLVYYRVKGLTALGEHTEAADLYSDYVRESRTHEGARRAGIAGRLLRLVDSFYGWRLRRFVARIPVSAE